MGIPWASHGHRHGHAASVDTNGKAWVCHDRLKLIDLRASVHYCFMPKMVRRNGSDIFYLYRDSIPDAVSCYWAGYRV